VDSALVLAIARRALGDRVVAAMGVSDAYSADEVASARAVATHVGVPLVEVPTGQLDDEDFLRNDSHRCFHCRTDLYAVLRPRAAALGLTAVADGTNADDLADYRPGRRAAVSAGVVSPLAAAGIRKAQVRAAAGALGLPAADRPQNACLSSRIPRGTPITLAALRRVDRAEAWLRERGFAQCRVREHGDLARIEVPAGDITRLAASPLRTECAAALRELGYVFVSLDLEGFESGRLNRLVPEARPAP
ncbi:MAG TPA: ATP-dependent sacrificial sulfur transferase LarE, partial [Candidatus Dormibacteraeota bacterium]|nr:ATP-dependent sacrificial sulfur transferase LarE [Candidatus Dormibacteraeota bacterium]